MSEEVSVVVGVRVRPFVDREKKHGAQLCVEMDGLTTILESPPDVLEEGSAKKKEYGPDGQLIVSKGKDPKRFTFDASFWSHDGFKEDETGHLRPLPGSRYADQQLVFESFGKKVLDSAWDGYHCCLFAYGQTGSGKSYSMVGYGANKGIVPITCEEIFRRIEANGDANLSFEIQVSMVEIYSEAVQDLLVPPKTRPKRGLEIRESQSLGIYIDGVSKRPVDSYASIEGVMEEGTQNRTVGATLMNATSSRAHTVITIEFKQVSKASGQTGCKVSLINLVDLAGSEKQSQSGAQGDRLKEGSAINKSLSALGNVIEKLADRATGKGKPGAPIPYRDSKLTRLLQNALGGSSKTVMICAISPASSNYEETLSTLRYADRAKRIKNAAVVNENPADKLIRQLREENAKLKDMVCGEQADRENDSEALALKQREIKHLEEALNEMQRSFQERLSEAQKQAAEKQKKKEAPKLPHIANLNEDQLLTNKLSFFFPVGQTRIGRTSVAAEEDAGTPEVGLAGPGIHEQHALVVNDGGACRLSAVSKVAGENTFVNGACVEAEGSGVALAHGDRVAFGQCLFVFVDPAQSTAAQLLASGKVSYAEARKELAELSGGAGAQGPSEEELRASREEQERLERRAREAEEAKSRAQQEAEAVLRQREEDFRRQLEQKQEEWQHEFRAREAAKDKATAEQHMRAHAAEVERLQQEFEERQQRAEEAAQRRIQELEAHARKAAAEEEDHRALELNMQRLEEQLSFVMPLVKEANLLCAELQRPHAVETRLQCDFAGDRARGLVSVVATVSRDGVRLFQWSPETLENRVFLLRELLQRSQEEEGFEVDSLSNEEDPLWDRIEVEQLIGVAQVLLEGLMMQVENTFDARILSPEGRQAGTLSVEVLPVGKDGTPGIPDDDVVEDPQALLGTRMAVLVRVEGAKGLPEALANDVRVEYSYFIDERPYQVPPVAGFNCNPDFSYSQTFVQDPVTSGFLQYLKKKLSFKVYGRDMAAARLATEEDSAFDTSQRSHSERIDASGAQPRLQSPGKSGPWAATEEPRKSPSRSGTRGGGAGGGGGEREAPAVAAGAGAGAHPTAHTHLTPGHATVQQNHLQGPDGGRGNDDVSRTTSSRGGGQPSSLAANRRQQEEAMAAAVSGSPTTMAVREASNESQKSKACTLL